MRRTSRSRIAKYYAMCEWFDETCGELLEHLDESGIAENTLVIYVTDNGWIQTEDGGYATAIEAQSLRRRRADADHVSLARRDSRQRIGPNSVRSIDIVPTILAAAGAEVPHDLPGLNLLPQLKSGEADRARYDVRRIVRPRHRRHRESAGIAALSLGDPRS